MQIRKIKLFADSTSDLNEELIQKMDISIVPLYVNFGEKQFKDGVDLLQKGLSLDEVVTALKMSEFYDQYGEIFYLNTVNINMDELHEIFLKELPPSATILDAGCGSGRDAYTFKNLGYPVEAMDASEKMVFLSSHLLDQKVFHLTFQAMDFENAFEGIWACASLLHVPSSDMPLVFNNLNRALKSEGILYITFKYGNFEGERHERYFNDFNEEKFYALEIHQYGFEVIKLWKTQDFREEHEGRLWLNIMLRKTMSNN